MDKTLMLNELKNALGFRSDAEFAKSIGIKPQVLSNWKSRNTFDPELLYTNCEGLNPSWLLSGKGQMIKTTSETVSAYRLRTDNNLTDQHIPVYNIEASAGLVDLFEDTNSNEVVDTLHIPNLPKCDGAVYVTGDSMYPLLKSGDLIAYKQIHDFGNEIFWGEMYLVSIEVGDEEYISVKYIQKSDKGEQYIKLASQNQHHQPKDVELGKVRALALVKASVRINSMG